MSLKTRSKKMVESRHMLSGIGVASFLESTIIPVPLEAVLIPLMQARRDKIWQIAWFATLGCIAGAIAGYALGYYVFDLIGDWLVNTFWSAEQFANAKQRMNTEGFWFVLTLGIVPIPFQIAMLAAGATKYSLALFLAATLIARSLRYFGLALVVYYAGNKAERLIRRYRWPVVAGFSLLVITLWWLTTLLRQ